MRKAALWLLDVDRRRKLKGRARTRMTHHQIPRLDGDQAQGCDGNLPFASRLVALLSIDGHWAGQAFVEGKSHFFRPQLKWWVLVQEGRKCLILQR